MEPDSHSVLEPLSGCSKAACCDPMHLSAGVKPLTDGPIGWVCFDTAIHTNPKGSRQPVWAVSLSPDADLNLRICQDYCVINAIDITTECAVCLSDIVM